MFNPEEFNNATHEEGSFETKRSLVPAGEYVATIGQFEAKTVGEANRPIIAAYYEVINTGDDSLDGRRIYDTIWLDVDDKGNLQRGPDKNLKLGQILEAVGLNGKPWNHGMVTGQPVLVQVTEGINKRSEEPENRVTRIAKA